MFYFFPQIIPKKKCKSIINRYLKKYKSKMKEATTLNTVNLVKQEPIYDSSYRKADVVFLEQEDEMYPRELVDETNLDSLIYITKALDRDGPLVIK